MSDARSTGVIDVEQSGGVLTVTLARPDQLNALNGQMREDLVALWAEVAQDSSVRVVVLTAAGRAFCSGADVGELATISRPGDRVDGRGLSFCPAAIVDVPVIVAINGLCVGGGLRFVADADIVLASQDAWFSDPHVSMGQTSGPLALQLAAASSALAVAPLVLCGHGYRLTAGDAAARGLVTEVVPPAALTARAAELAGMIASQSPTAVRRTVGILRRVTREALEEQLSDAWASMGAQGGHPDTTEGPAAFADRRDALWVDP
jgi:enoyl-CoA hydratase/carnithine racemase